MYRFLFGPVPSRRLGMSLGVDLVPHKVCSLDCIYCECGPTTKLSLERMEYVPYSRLVEELEHYFRHNPDPDYFTFSGSGEPVLNNRIRDVIRFIKMKKPDIPIALLTNGSMFKDPSVRQELLDVDVVLPSLDAARQETFEKVNRPAAGLNIRDYINGQKSFSREFKGDIWLEVFILPGYNDSPEDLDALKAALLEIRPDRIQLNTLDRPGTVEKLQAAKYSRLEEIKTYWQLDNVEIIAAAPKRKEIKSYRQDKETAILETIRRRPCTLQDLADILGKHSSEINKYLDVLEAEGKIKRVQQDRGLFYKIGRKA